MTEEEKNAFQRYDYYTTLFDDKGKPREVKVTDLSDEDFRRWLMWKLPRLVIVREREKPKPPKKASKKKTTKKTKKTQPPAPKVKN